MRIGVVAFERYFAKWEFAVEPVLGSSDVGGLIRSIRPETRIVVVNAPHNPTGMLPSVEEWRRLGSACAERQIRLVADEVYRFLEHDGAETLPAGADLDERAISIGVMSKSFALAGLRIGWLATRDRSILDRCARMKDYTTICSSAPSEVLALIALRARERVLARSRSIVDENLRAARDFIAANQDEIEWVPPRAGSTAFPRFRKRNADQVSQQLAERES